MFDNGTTLQHGRSQTPNTLTCCAVGSRAKTSAMPAARSALTESEADCGQNLPASLAKYDHESSSWRTSQLCLTGELDEFSGTWPRWGTMRNGALFRAAEWVRHTCESVCSLWPTPRAGDRDNCGGSNARKKAKRMGTYIGRAVNPEWQESLMGFPIGWSDCEGSGMLSTPESGNGLDEN